MALEDGELEQFIAQLPNCERVDFSNRDLAQNEISGIYLATLEHGDRVTEFNLSGNQIDLEQLEEDLARENYEEILFGNNLRILKLNNCGIGGSEALGLLHQAIDQNPNLEELHLAGNLLTNDVAQQLLGSLLQHENLTVLNLNGNEADDGHDITEETLLQIEQALQRNRNRKQQQEEQDKNGKRDRDDDSDDKNYGEKNNGKRAREGEREDEFSDVQKKQKITDYPSTIVEVKTVSALEVAGKSTIR